MLVDDSAVMRAMIRKTISRCNLEVGEIEEAANGKEGLEKLNENWFDLLFIDVNMPIMDGMEMLEEIRRKPDTRDLPVLIVSTESNEQRIKRIGELKAGFVHKPFTPETLRSSILEQIGVGEY